MTPDQRRSGPIGGGGKTIEADETYVGGKAKNAHKNKPNPPKRPVVALVERNGEVRAQHVADVTAKTVRNVLVTQASRKNKLMTDREYVRGKAHVNTAESFFANLKRQILGQRHAVSEQHLQRYVSEVAFKWNNRSALGIEDAERANNALKRIGGKRLTYRPVDRATDA